MNLAIDIGNTEAKIGIFDDNKLQNKTIIKKIDKDKIIDIKNEFPKTSNAILSTVATVDNNIMEYLKNSFNVFIVLNETTKLPFINKYKTNETLGKDRIAAVAGANNIFPNTNVLIIDIGTAVTYEFLSENNEYLGGNISPGLNLRYKSLFEFTDKLPLLKVQEECQEIGTNTHDAIIAGVQNGMLFEIEGYIKQMSMKFKDLKIILTGGHSDLFAKRIKSSIFVHPNLVLIGLNRILNYNAKNI